MEVHTARYCLIMWEPEKEIMMCPLFMHQQVQAAVRADKQREQAEKSGNRTRRIFDRGGR